MVKLWLPVRIITLLGIVAVCAYSFTVPSSSWANEALKKNVKPTVSQTSEDMRSLWNKASQAAARGQQKECATFFELALKACPPADKSNLCTLHKNLGLTYAERREFQLSLNHYQEAYFLDDQDPESIYNIAASNLNLGKLGLALQWYNKYLQDFPAGKDSARARQMVATLSDAQQSKEAQSTDYLDESDQNTLARWQANKMPIHVYIEPGDKIPGYRKELRQFISDAFNAWAAASGGAVAWQLVDRPIEDGINVQWVQNPEELSNFQAPGRSATGMEQGHAKTETEYIGGKLYIFRCNVQIATYKEGTVMPNETIKATCFHEIGHALGISGHSTNINDTMNSYCPSTGLSNRDKATIKRLYQSPGN